MKNFVFVFFLCMLGCNYSPARDACYRKLYQQKYAFACTDELFIAYSAKDDDAKKKISDPQTDIVFNYFLIKCLQRMETQRRCDKKSNYTLEYNPP